MDNVAFLLDRFELQWVIPHQFPLNNRILFHNVQILVPKTREEAYQQNENKWNESCRDVLEPSCSEELIRDFYLLFENGNEVI